MIGLLQNHSIVCHLQTFCYNYNFQSSNLNKCNQVNQISCSSKPSVLLELNLAKSWDNQKKYWLFVKKYTFSLLRRTRSFSVNSWQESASIARRAKWNSFTLSHCVTATMWHCDPPGWEPQTTPKKSKPNFRIEVPSTWYAGDQLFLHVKHRIGKNTKQTYTQKLYTNVATQSKELQSPSISWLPQITHQHSCTNCSVLYLNNLKP